MKKLSLIATIAFATIVVSCSENKTATQENEVTQTENSTAGQSGVQDDVSQKNIVQAAMGSKDHSTLVAAVKQAELVDALSNAGPFTVFAPVNAAFDALPAGTVDDLMKNENKEKLTDILQYHVSIGVFKEEMLQEGQSIGQANGSNITISKKDGQIVVNGKAKVLAAIPVSNGLIYAIDQVLLPQ
ncbi:MAG TPA: fasciclin domain-containing protein [Flavipsychrobacter sp.]|nr:fasciclin domain-containing protein [Flavipsychrobacter sp.]